LLEDHVPLDLGSTGEWFGRRVIGQEEAVGQVLDILALIKARLARPRKPLASLLFIGPTGTGKTELTKALAEFLFGDAARLVRFDLNEFSDPAAVQRLIGGSTGVEGLLTARIREQPFSVVLLDEFEKADASFFDLLLQMLGDGRLTDAAGRVADFSNSVIVMTSNLGSQSFQRGPAGFRADNSITPEATEHFSDAVRSFLRPEIYNRFDAIVPFRPLTRQQVLQIAQRQLEMLKLRDGLRLRQIDLEIEAGVAERLVQVGFNPRYGARPLKRAVEREVLTPLSEALVSYFDDVPLRATVSVFQNRIRVEARAKTEKRLESSPAGPPELVLSVCQERRRIGRLKQSSAASALENQMTMIAALERRLKSASWKSSEQTAALAKLPSLRSCLEALQSLSARAGQVETELLVSFYARENLDRILFESERTSLFQERRRLTCEVLRLSQDNPGHIVVALYSEDREWLIELTRAYFGLANQLGKVLRLDCFVPPKTGRSIGTGAVRETPKAIDKWFESPPEKLIGLVMEWKGDLFAPRFASEAGLHTMRRGKKPLTVLVETSGGAFEQYAAPAGIDRPGTIENKGAPVQRVYLAERQQVDDRVLGEVPWPSLSVQNGLGTLIEGRLEKVLENLIA
ncbi:MAG: AAA family ATPase, partial [Verrucomicrobiota bacterium]